MILSRRKTWRQAACAVALLGCVAAPSHAARAQAAHGAVAGNTTASAEAPPDDLYRRRGYGMGGLTFGLGRQGGTAQAGACADLAFARPRNCGPRGNYGVYGNGLGYGFGL